MAVGTLAALLAALLLISAASCQQPLNATGAKAVTLASISPPTLEVDLAFNIDGDTAATACATDQLNQACLPKVKAASEDTVTITYTNPQPVEDGQFVQLKACYSNASQIDRPWRATQPVISKSKKCPITIKSGLPAAGGNATWTPNDNAAIATYFVRAYVMLNSTGTPPVPYQVAFGNSVGYFQIDPIDPRPKSLIVASAVCSCVGPLMFGSYFLINYLRTKKRAT